MFWWLTKKIIFWLWAGWVASYLQRSLSAQVNGGPDATPNLWKQLFSAVRASGGYPGNVLLYIPSTAMNALDASIIVRFLMRHNRCYSTAMSRSILNSISGSMMDSRFLWIVPPLVETQPGSLQCPNMLLDWMSQAGVPGTAKLTGLRTLADKRWVGPVKRYAVCTAVLPPIFGTGTIILPPSPPPNLTSSTILFKSCWVQIWSLPIFSM